MALSSDLPPATEAPGVRPGVIVKPGGMPVVFVERRQWESIGENKGGNPRHISVTQSYSANLMILLLQNIKMKPRSTSTLDHRITLPLQRLQLEFPALHNLDSVTKSLVIKNVIHSKV